MRRWPPQIPVSCMPPERPSAELPYHSCGLLYPARLLIGRCRLELKAVSQAEHQKDVALFGAGEIEAGPDIDQVSKDAQ